MRLIILGAGGHGKVVADIAGQTGKYSEIKFLDDKATGTDIVGTCADYLKFKDNNTEMYPAFGNNKGRVEWEEKIEAAGIKLAIIIHPLAYVSPKATVASGCVVMPYAIVNTGTVVNKACIINCGAIVDHDCVLKAGCHLAPGAIVKGENYLPDCIKVDSGEIVPLQFYKSHLDLNLDNITAQKI